MEANEIEFEIVSFAAFCSNSLLSFCDRPDAGLSAVNFVSDRFQIWISFRHSCKPFIELYCPVEMLTSFVQLAQLRGVACKVELNRCAIGKFFACLQQNIFGEDQALAAPHGIRKGHRP